MDKVTYFLNKATEYSGNARQSMLKQAAKAMVEAHKGGKL